MKNSKSNPLVQLKKIDRKVVSFALTAIPLIIILGVLFHFLFELTGSHKFSGIFLPVNESIFEHLKLCLYPTIIVWFIGAIYLEDKTNLDISKFIISMTGSIITSMITVLALYYIGSSGFNIHSITYDISTIIIGTILGQILSIHIYNNISSNNKNVAYAYLILILFVIFFGYFTFNPPNLPIFLDGTTNTYGIHI